MADLPMHYQTRYAGEQGVTDGTVSIDSRPDTPVGSPHDEGRYSPDDLLLAAAEVCLANTVAVIAPRSKLEIHGYRSQADGELEFVPKAGYRFKRIVIVPEVVVDAGNESLVRKVIDKSHGACLISRSLNCPVEVDPQIRTR